MIESILNSARAKYNAKLLLFGEFTIIDGGAALSTPLNQFYGSWDNHQQDPRIIEFLNSLLQFSYLDHKKIKAVINASFRFKSQIPIGYGLGSSGAITAACFDLFKLNEDHNYDNLMDLLAEMESFFHGKSSGLDPLTIYLNKTIEINSKRINVLDKFPNLKNLFLIDSNKARNTDQIIKTFYEKKETSEDFKKALMELDRLNKKAINALLNEDTNLLKASFKKISQLQWSHFQEMIVDDVKALWKKGLKTDEYYLKLSGAGGGGFYLGLGEILEKQVIKLDA